MNGENVTSMTPINFPFLKRVALNDNECLQLNLYTAI